MYLTKVDGRVQVYEMAPGAPRYGNRHKEKAGGIILRVNVRNLTNNQHFLTLKIGIFLTHEDTSHMFFI